MSDLIDRQVAIDKLQKEINKGIPPFDDVMGAIRCGVRLARNIIEDLPSAQPQRKTARWEILYPNHTYKYHCSECGANHKYMFDFCPSCGAKMDGEANE